MAKTKPAWELLPHQYAEQKQGKLRPFSKGESNSRYWEYREVIDLIQGKTPCASIYKNRMAKDVKATRGHMHAVNELLNATLDEYWQVIYQATQAGLPVDKRIYRLKSKEELEEMARNRGWVNYANPYFNVAVQAKKHKANPKSLPKRDDPEDKFHESFSREDKKDTW